MMHCCEILPQGLLKSPGSTLGIEHPRVPEGFATLPGVLTKSSKNRKMRHPELIVLVDFKAIYPRVPQGIFAGFPGVGHFLSFEEICQYPRVPQGKVANPWGTLGYYFPGVDPREIKIPEVHLTFLKHLNITNFLNEQYLVFLCTFLLIFSYSSFHILLIHPLLFFTSCSSLLILLTLIFSSHSSRLILFF
jgi:hypothetical protein